MIGTALTLLRAVGGFLRTPLGQVLAAAVGLLALLWITDARGYSRGVAAERGRWERQLAADREKAAKTTARQATAGAVIGTRVEERQAQVRTITKTLIREIPIYVTDKADARCDVPDGLVRLHDAAAAGVSAAPDPAGRPADAASGVALSAVAGTVVENYGACHAAIEQVKGWQAWWSAISTPQAF